MRKIWTKPVIGVGALTLAGAFTLSLDGVAQAADPLTPHKPRDTFQLAVTSTASDVIITMQNTITGEEFVVPWPETIKRERRRSRRVAE
jgi:hypothetical protein